MSEAGSLVVSTITRSVTTHTVDGATTAPHEFVRLKIDTPNGVLVVTLDAGDWSRALAHPGTASAAELTLDSYVPAA